MENTKEIVDLIPYDGLENELYITVLTEEDIRIFRIEGLNHYSNIGRLKTRSKVNHVRYMKIEKRIYMVYLSNKRLISVEINDDNSDIAEVSLQKLTNHENEIIKIFDIKDNFMILCTTKGLSIIEFKSLNSAECLYFEANKDYEDSRFVSHSNKLNVVSLKEKKVCFARFNPHKDILDKYNTINVPHVEECNINVVGQYIYVRKEGKIHEIGLPQQGNDHHVSYQLPTHFEIVSIAPLGEHHAFYLYSKDSIYYAYGQPKSKPKEPKDMVDPKLLKDSISHMKNQNPQKLSDERKKRELDLKELKDENIKIQQALTQSKIEAAQYKADLKEKHDELINSELMTQRLDETIEILLKENKELKMKQNAEKKLELTPAATIHLLDYFSKMDPIPSLFVVPCLRLIPLNYSAHSGEDGFASVINTLSTCSDDDVKKHIQTIRSIESL
eukprot:CAMPEP_0117425572 /NCGR_PEP_ID=MMETSP0758-20121206/5829_1 /TAXON_ID=63605 /ORGANISM="Percolomonas cosmopolitus, Strain AE-1 (ATCC 50343)" /LENGTH=443 /DNA_ID=CAMNT_0005210161 /DNA_START=187 /DNA_END=1515 /DNA_ORIENTATION=-